MSIRPLRMLLTDARVASINRVLKKKGPLEARTENVDETDLGCDDYRK
jgi:hypothetical protein